MKDADGWLPLHHAAAGGHAALCALLLGAHSDVDDVAHDGDTALHKAALGGHLDVVRLLLAARCQVRGRANGVGPGGGVTRARLCSLLHACSCQVKGDSYGRQRTCMPMPYLQQGQLPTPAVPAPQVDVRNTSGSTALYNAASQGHTGVLQELLHAGAAGAKFSQSNKLQTKHMRALLRLCRLCS